MSASHLKILTYLTGMLVSDLTIPSPVTLLLVVSIIEVAVIIKAAVAVMTDAGATLGRGPFRRILPIPAYLGDIATNPNLHLDLAEGIDLIQAVKAGLDHLKEGMAIAPEVIMAQSLQITNTQDMPPDHPRRTHNQSLKQSDEAISHRNHPMKLISSMQFLWNQWSQLWIKLPKILFSC